MDIKNEKLNPEKYRRGCRTPNWPRGYGGHAQEVLRKILPDGTATPRSKSAHLRWAIRFWSVVGIKRPPPVCREAVFVCYAAF